MRKDDFLHGSVRVFLPSYDQINGLSFRTNLLVVVRVALAGLATLCSHNASPITRGAERPVLPHRRKIEQKKCEAFYMELTTRPYEMKSRQDACYSDCHAKFVLPPQFMPET